MGDIVSAPSRRVGPLRWWDGDRGPIDSLWAVGVARATVVAFVQREGGSADDCSEGDRDRKRVDARGFQYQSGARRHYDTVDHRDHSGGRERQLPCAGWERRSGACSQDSEEVRLELRRDLQVEAA